MQDETQENKKPKRIDSTSRYLLIGTAIIFDLISIIPVVGQILAIGGAAITFYIWFKILGVSFISPKKIVTTVVEYLGEAIPVVSALPLITTGTIIMIVLTDIEDKTGIGVAGMVTGKIPKDQLRKDVSRTINKTARREANPERFAQAQERLARMKERKANAGVSPTGHQTMKDINISQKPSQKINTQSPVSQNSRPLSPASERLRLIRGDGQKISAPSQQLLRPNGSLANRSPSNNRVENTEQRAA